MKAENKKMAAELTSSLLPKFKGLSEKGAAKMVKAVENAAEELAKKFHRLQDDDQDAANKLLKKAAKKQEKAAKKAADKQEKAAEKAAKQAKIAVITGSSAKAQAAPKATAPAKKLATPAKKPATKAPAKKTTPPSGMAND